MQNGYKISFGHKGINTTLGDLILNGIQKLHCPYIIIWYTFVLIE